MRGPPSGSAEVALVLHTVAAVALLSLPVLLPTVLITGLRPSTFFLVPLAGSVLAAIATWFELALGGSLLFWYLILALVANVAAAFAAHDIGVRVLRRYRRGPAGVWPWLTLVVVLTAVGWPLQALRVPIYGGDALTQWTLHSLFIFQGHQMLHDAVLNHAFTPSNPDYPPLVPATGALAYVSEGGADIRLALIMTSVLNACGLGLIACGIVEAVGRNRRVVIRIAAVAVAAGVALAGFGFSGDSGLYSVGGEADLPWAAAAVAAIVFGLILPRALQNLSVAWICVVMASLTKNEGLTTALMVILLISIRYVVVRPVPPQHSSKAAGATVSMLRTRLHRALSVWIKRTVLAAAMAAPGLAWLILIKAMGINDAFFTIRRTESVGQRISPTLAGIADNLHVLPVAAVLVILGSLALRPYRTELQLGNPGFLWLVVGGSLIALTVTYVFGGVEIHQWLFTSIDRTTAFANLALYVDMSIWLVVAVCAHKPTVAPRRSVVPLDVEPCVSVGAESAGIRSQ
jgi:hypothetical protein